MFAKAYTKSLNQQVVLSGFEKWGLWPIKPDIFEGAFTSAHQTSYRTADDTTDATVERIYKTSNRGFYRKNRKCNRFLKRRG